MNALRFDGRTAIVTGAGGEREVASSGVKPYRPVL
jgi:hypothetical protein